MLGVKEQYISCRIYGHQWESTEVEFEELISETLVCEKCDAIRIDHIRRGSGTVVSRTYKYPKDYERKNLPRFGVEERGKLRVYNYHKRDGFAQK